MGEVEPDGLPSDGRPVECDHIATVGKEVAEAVVAVRENARELPELRQEVVSSFPQLPHPRIGVHLGSVEL